MSLGPFAPIPPREKIRRSHINDLRTALTGIQDAYDVAVANGFVGTRGQWLDSLKGEKGDPGVGLAPIGSAETYEALPEEGNTVGDVRTVDADGRAYRWDGSDWVDVGLFRGPGGEDTDLRERIDPGAAGAARQSIKIIGGVPAWVNPPAIYDSDYPDIVGNGTTDDSAAIQAMIDAAPAHNARIVFTKPAYRLDSSVVITGKHGLELVGNAAAGQDGSLGLGGTRFLVGSGVTGFVFDSSAATSFRGPTFRNMVFWGQAGAVGGVRLIRTNNYLLDHIICADFDDSAGAFGIQIDGTLNTSQYGTIRDPGIHRCMTGIDLINCNGTTIFGGYLDGNGNTGTPPGIGSIGVHDHGDGDTNKLFGTRIQMYDTGIKWADGEYHEAHGVRFEGNTTCLSIGAGRCSVFGGSFNNFISGGTGVGIDILAAAADTLLWVPKMGAFTTPIADAGTNTVRLHDRSLRFPTSGEIRIGSTLVSETATGALNVNNNLRVTSNLTVNQGNGSGKLLFGSGNDTNLYRHAANVLRTDDAFRVMAVATASRPSAATVGAGGMVFDTTLNKPIWSDGTDWRDAAGTVV